MPPRKPFSSSSLKSSVRLPQNKAAKGGVLSCLGCLGIIGLFFGLAIIVGIVNAITGNTPDSKPVAAHTSSSATPVESPSESPSPTASEGSSSSPSATPSPSPTSEEAVPLEKEKNVATVVSKDTAASSDSQATIEKLNTLEVKGRAPKTGYNRSQFGQAWADVDHNGCDTRNDILRRDLTSITVKPGTQGCKVMSGVLDDPYVPHTIQFKRGKDTSDDVQIDHVVSLSDAWQTGAQAISATDREQFANDPMNLLAVDGPANQAKGDGDAATWLPNNKDFRCTYVSKQIDVKAKYHLWVKEAEKQAMIDTLKNCGAVLPEKTATPTPVAPKQTQEAPAPAPAPVKEAPAPAPVEQAPAPAAPGAAQPAPVAPVPVAPAPVQQAPAAGPFPNCTAARQAGAAPLYAGQPGYAPKLDRDRDGVACE